MPIDEVLEALARSAAAGFANFECNQCAIAVAKAVGKESAATFQVLRTSDSTDVIVLVARDEQISINAYHVGVRIGEIIVDNHYPEGVTAEAWPQCYVAATRAPLVQASRPIADFFGKVFLTKKFREWVSRRDGGLHYDCY